MFAKQKAIKQPGEAAEWKKTSISDYHPLIPHYYVKPERDEHASQAGGGAYCPPLVGPYSLRSDYFATSIISRTSIHREIYQKRHLNFYQEGRVRELCLNIVGLYCFIALRLYMSLTSLYSLAESAEWINEFACALVNIYSRASAAVCCTNTNFNWLIAAWINKVISNIPIIIYRWKGSIAKAAVAYNAMELYCNAHVIRRRAEKPFMRTLKFSALWKLSLYVGKGYAHFEVTASRSAAPLPLSRRNA